MDKQRLIPLIVATALFMENMDSTVIATSLPAIAADIGTSPLTLKLAITSYLLSLAVFIPASGWTADRFGARAVFSIAIGVFMVGSIGCALSTSVTDFVIARIIQGIGGAMMAPVGGLVLAGLGVAGLAFGLSVAGLGLLPWQIVVGLIVGGAISMGLYLYHAKRTASPVLDFTLIKHPTLRASLTGGFMYRLGIGALP